MNNPGDTSGINTFLNHPPLVTLAPGNTPLLQPIYQSAKFSPNEELPYWEQFVYGRISNPTLRQLEKTLAHLQQREDCVVVSSGIGAITGMLLGLVRSGDHVITFQQLYKPTRMFVRDVLPRYGISHSLLDLSRLAEIESAIIPGKTKLIHFESPTNPNLFIADIEGIIKIARRHGVLVTMDGTFAGLHQHTHFDIDLMVQSLTKFGNGHGDVIAGSIAGRQELIKKIREITVYLGAHLDPQACYLIQRGLKTYFLRYERHCSNARAIAQFLQSHPRVKSVVYPGLDSHPQHSLALRQMNDMGAVVAFAIDPSVAPSADAFCHRLRLIQLAASLGATETIIAPTLPFFGTDLPENLRETLGINQHTLRLSVGLEDVSDLIRDLSFALSEEPK